MNSLINPRPYLAFPVCGLALVIALGLCFMPSPSFGEETQQMLIPAGEFLMGTEAGSAIERPLRKVHLSAFYLDTVAVSNLRYETFAPQYRRSHASSCDQCPATRIPWAEADRYCRQHGKRLPTEAEWEKAARGPEGWDFSFAKTADVSLGHFGRSLNTGTVPVDSLKPNGYGLYHMSGNAWEWVQDWFDAEYYQSSAMSNPKGPDSGFRKALRGGSWYNKSYYAHVGMRFALHPDTRLTSVGFRCAKDAETESGATR
jgi:formylglycine-generating enzyme required for sulfatase activity